MAQSYFPGQTRSKSPPAAQESSLSDWMGEKQLRVEDVQEAYVEQKDRLLHAIDSTTSVLGDIRRFNKEDWVVRYPHLRESSTKTEPLSNPKRPGARRSLTFADDPTSETEVVMAPKRQGLQRSLTLASIADAQETEDSVDDAKDEERLIPSSDTSSFQVLRLDLKIGPPGSSTSPEALVSQLEKASIANLLDERIGASTNHIAKLRLRVEDTSSKVLVTGDLNAGKSTFVNALLRREVMPVDQQPCTTAFCEVHDAAENGGVEEVHIIKEGATYSIKDETTFTRSSLSELETIVGDNETQPMIKLYLADTRAPSESLLNNGVVDISLIDAPGLNRDSIQTTALFARQEEIDVVVFVVSAENHFTLSAKEFLLGASNEKAFIFIVVNKYEQIKNKEKCRRLVLDQIKMLSPRTYEDSKDLVHFVDSAAALQPYTANPAFDDLESSLRSFVLVKRSKSKLQPVSTYLSNLLSDIDLLAGANGIVANVEVERAKADLNRARPVLKKMRGGRDLLEDGLEAIEEEGASRVSSRSKKILDDALDRVSQGIPGVANAVMPTYPGLLGIWDYTRDVRRALLQSLDLAVKGAEDEARGTTSAGVKKVSQLSDEHLPEGIERSPRVFMPEAMFSVQTMRGSRSKSRRASLASGVVASGIHGLGIGLAHRPDLLETTLFDIFDASHQFWVQFGDADDEKVSESGPSALSVASVGVGALTMVGGNVFGIRALVEGMVRLSDLLSNESARKWAAPVLGACALGLTGYVILELPSTIPKTIGRRVRTSLVRRSEGTSEETLFVQSHAGRISRETRKVLRLASWDVRERFRGAMDQSTKDVKVAEEMEKKAQKAVEFFHSVVTRTGEVRESAGLVNTLA